MLEELIAVQLIPTYMDMSNFTRRVIFLSLPFALMYFTVVDPHPVAISSLSPCPVVCTSVPASNPLTGCFNPWNAALSCGPAVTAGTWPQSRTPGSRTQTSSSSEQDPQVSVSSIYTLCIFATGRMISMLALNARERGSHLPQQMFGDKNLVSQFILH